MIRHTTGPLPDHMRLPWPPAGNSRTSAQAKRTPVAAKSVELPEGWKEKVEASLSICRQCEYYKGNTRVTVSCAKRPSQSCSACNLLNGWCPEGKWGTRPQRAGSGNTAVQRVVGANHPLP